MTEETERCSAWTRAGMQCQHRHGLVNSLCLFHDPERRDELKAMRQRGQAAAMVARQETRRVRAALASETAGERPPVGATLQSVGNFVRWILEAGVRRELTQGEVAALTSGARVLDSLYSKADLERRVKALSAELVRLQKVRKSA